MKKPSEFEALFYRAYVRRKIADGIRAADEGRVVSHSTVREMFRRKYVTRRNSSKSER